MTVAKAGIFTEQLHLSGFLDRILVSLDAGRFTSTKWVIIMCSLSLAVISICLLFHETQSQKSPYLSGAYGRGGGHGEHAPYHTLRTCAITERFCSGDSLRRGAISSVWNFTFYIYGVSPQRLHDSLQTAILQCHERPSWVLKMVENLWAVEAPPRTPMRELSAHSAPKTLTKNSTHLLAFGSSAQIFGPSVWPLMKSPGHAFVICAINNLHHIDIMAMCSRVILPFYFCSFVCVVCVQSTLHVVVNL